MTSNELKHQARTQEWGVAIQECRSSGLSVREWCRQRGVTTTTYYRWEREVLSSIRRKDAADRSAAVFVELPAPQPLRNVSERTVTLNLGKGSIDLYQEMSPNMLSDFTGADKVYIACGYTDLRKGIDGLASMVQQQFQLDPFTNTLFLFCGRRRDRIKGLYWEKDGFILLYKRLERGAYQWPRSENEVRSLTPQQYRWLMEGLKIEQPKAHCPVLGLSMV